MGKDKYADNRNAISLGLSIAQSHPLIRNLKSPSSMVNDPKGLNLPSNSWVEVEIGARSRWQNGVFVYFNVKRKATPQEWAYVVARLCVHQALNHFELSHENNLAWHAACWAIADALVTGAGVGTRPSDLSPMPVGYPMRDEGELSRMLDGNNLPVDFMGLSLGALGKPFWSFLPGWKPDPNLKKSNAADLARGLREAALAAIGSIKPRERASLSASLQRAISFVISEYPLFSASAAAFSIIEDEEVCDRMDIPVAAVQCEQKEIYFNPKANLSYDEYIFVFAHEVLHASLRHDRRRMGRDAYLWNVACDYVINAWLIEMRVGAPPESKGYLYDPELKGMSAEDIYDKIAGDMRLRRKMMKMKLWGGGDIRTDKPKEWWTSGGGVDLDAFYRRALSEGLKLHMAQGRGLLPAGLVEEINAMAHDPIPWDVELSHWLDQYFEPLERRRTYARASRRQSSSPDIIRPAWYTPYEEYRNRTFGVVLDTSGSMDRYVLAKAMGAIASYAMSRDVSMVRLIQCDAYPFDTGYVDPESLMGKVEVHGRGGTVLKPGLDLLESADDFPKDAPILFITDGGIDTFNCMREHAWLMPEKSRLPFKTEAPIFKLDG